MPSYQNAAIALRTALWAMLRSSHPRPMPYGMLVHRATEQGFTAAQARNELHALAESGAVTFGADEGRVIVRISGRGGAV